MEFRTRKLVPMLANGLCPQNEPLLGLHCDIGGASKRYALSAHGALLVTLRAPIQVQCGDSQWRLAAGEAYFLPALPAASDACARSELQLQSEGAFLVLRASETTWRVLFEQMQSLGFDALYPLAGRWRHARLLARSLLSLVQGQRKQQRPFLQPEDLIALAGGMRVGMAELFQRARQCPGRNTRQRAQLLSRLLRVRMWIKLGFTERLSIEEMAACANYSRSHFLALFRKVFGQSPHALVVDRRLRLARHLLSTRGYSVAEATLASGFEDRASFSKLFSKHFGVTALATKQASSVAPKAVR